jgi:ribosome-binding protein aMBF1 (putative translation factor)
MICEICGKNQATFQGILDTKVVNICEICARTEGLPIVKKPTQEQLDRANQRYTVRERMMKISGMDKLHPVSRDHEIAQRHLGKIKIPEKVQKSDSLVENYNWNIKIGRRRKKMTTSQLAQLAGTTPGIIDSLEKGMLMKDYEKIAERIESVLDIQLLKAHERKIKFIMPPEKPVEIPKDVSTENSLEEMETAELKRSVAEQNIKRKHEARENIERIQKGEFDFSKKENLQNVTLDDLIKAKKEREAKERKEKKNDSAEDLELE